MSEIEGSESFRRLPQAMQDHVKATNRQMLQLATAHAVPVLFGPPAWQRGLPRTGTACLLRIGGRCFAATAGHILDAYEARLAIETKVVWQIGAFGFDPLPRVVSRDSNLDVVLFEITEEETRMVGPEAVARIATFSKAAITCGQFALISGYPASSRETDPSGTIGFGPVACKLRVAAVGSDYFYCQVEREHLISFDDQPLLPRDFDYGGWSGSPVLLVGSLSYPIVGIVSEYQESFELLRVARLSAVDWPSLRTADRDALANAHS